MSATNSVSLRTAPLNTVAGKLADFKDVFTLTGADAALAASLFHYGELSVKQVKDFLRQEGIAVRKDIAD